MNKKVVFVVATVIAIVAAAIGSIQVPALLRADGANSFLPVIRRSFAPQLKPFVTDLAPPAVVTDIVDPGDGRFFIATRDGRIQISAPNGTLQPGLLLDIRDKVYEDGNEMGLVGLAVHPDFAANDFIYVYYTEAVPGESNEENYYSVLARYTVGPDGRTDPATEERILHFQLPTTKHHGGALQFGPQDGYLYISVGDGGTGRDWQGHAQSKETLLGKVLRIDVNKGSPYTIPPDNPFVADKDSRGEIWALGLRNPWRITFDRQTGDMFIGDVGEETWEEIDYIPAGSGGGHNFAWPCMEGPDVFRAAVCKEDVNYSAPIFAYRHNETGCGSVIGGYLYRGSRIPELAGHYLLGDLCGGNLWSLKPDGAQGWIARDWGAYGLYLTTFGERADGELFLGASHNLTIYQITGIEQQE